MSTGAVTKVLAGVLYAEARILGLSTHLDDSPVHEHRCSKRQVAHRCYCQL